jgi:hypothetical protein
LIDCSIAGFGHWHGEIPLNQPNADRPAKGYADRLFDGPGMLAQFPDGAAGLDQLVCVALELPHSGWQDPAGLDRRNRGRWPGLRPPADFVYISRVTLYSKALGAAIAQATDDTCENHERAVLRELLSTMNLEGILIQSDALHTQKPFFGSSRSRGPTSSRR